ncbi:hypothetical protein [Metamycoplasma hyosynoviae]|nr:hypothetical protein [Metamycoplasma hyosynoviae]
MPLQSAELQLSQGGEAKIMSGLGKLDKSFIKLKFIKERSIRW